MRPAGTAPSSRMKTRKARSGSEARRGPVSRHIRERPGAGGAGLKVRSLFGDATGTCGSAPTATDSIGSGRPAVRMFAGADGLPNTPIMTVIWRRATARYGRGANCGGISRFDGTRFQTFDEKHGLLNSCVYAIAEDAKRDCGSAPGAAARSAIATAIHPIRQERGHPDDRVTSIVAGRDGTMWFGTRGGVVRLKDGQFRSSPRRRALRRCGPSESTKIARASGGPAQSGPHRLVGERFEY